MEGKLHINNSMKYHWDRFGSFFLNKKKALEGFYLITLLIQDQAHEAKSGWSLFCTQEMFCLWLQKWGHTYYFYNHEHELARCFIDYLEVLEKQSNYICFDKSNQTFIEELDLGSQRVKIVLASIDALADKIPLSLRDGLEKQLASATDLYNSTYQT